MNDPKNLCKCKSYDLTGQEDAPRYEVKRFRGCSGGVSNRRCARWRWI
jgi:hypothetical protein